MRSSEQQNPTPTVTRDPTNYLVYFDEIYLISGLVRAYLTALELGLYVLWLGSLPEALASDFRRSIVMSV